MIGKKFGRLTVVSLFARKPVRWNCECACGGNKVVATPLLNRGGTTSCGCYQKQRQREGKTTHGWSKTKEYNAFLRARERCVNKGHHTFEYYGGRGIEFRFSDFLEFLAEAGPAPSPQHSIDRIDPEGHYEPGNVRWAEGKTQARNKRTNVYFTIGEDRKTLAEWCEVHGQNYKRAHGRIKSGWSVKDALTRVGSAP